MTAFAMTPLTMVALRYSGPKLMAHELSC